MITSSIESECIMAEETEPASCYSCYVHVHHCTHWCFSQPRNFALIQVPLKLLSRHEPLSCTSITRLSIDQSHPLENLPLRFLPVATPRLWISPSLQIYPGSRTSLAYPTTVKLPTLDALRVPSQIPLKRRPRRPSRHSAAHSPPRTDDDIDPAVQIGVLGFGIGFQIGGSAGPVGILPYDERLVQSVEAVAAQAGGADGERFLVAFAGGEVQGQGVGDPALFFEGFDHFVDEVVGHGFGFVGEDQVYVSAAKVYD